MKAAFWVVGFAQYMRKRETKTLQNMGSKDANRERVKKMLAQALASSLLSLVRGFGIGTPNWPPMIRGDDVMVLWYNMIRYDNIII